MSVNNIVLLLSLFLNIEGLCFRYVVGMQEKPVKKMNILMIGKTRSGKSVLTELLENPNKIFNDSNIYSETKETYKKSITIDSPETKYVIDVIDTPGLFDLRVGEKVLSNEDIFKQLKDFLNKENIKSVNIIFFLFSLTEGIKIEDMEAFELYKEKLFPDTLQDGICMVITRCEKLSFYGRKKLFDDIKKYVYPKTNEKLFADWHMDLASRLMVFKLEKNTIDKENEALLKENIKKEEMLDYYSKKIKNRETDEKKVRNATQFTEVEISRELTRIKEDIERAEQSIPKLKDEIEKNVIQIKNNEFYLQSQKQVEQDLKDNAKQLLQQKTNSGMTMQEYLNNSKTWEHLFEKEKRYVLFSGALTKSTEESYKENVLTMNNILRSYIISQADNKIDLSTFLKDKSDQYKKVPSQKSQPLSPLATIQNLLTTLKEKLTQLLSEVMKLTH